MATFGPGVRRETGVIAQPAGECAKTTSNNPKILSPEQKSIAGSSRAASAESGAAARRSNRSRSKGVVAPFRLRPRCRPNHRRRRHRAGYGDRRRGQLHRFGSDRRSGPVAVPPPTSASGAGTGAGTSGAATATGSESGAVRPVAAPVPARAARAACRRRLLHGKPLFRHRTTRMYTCAMSIVTIFPVFSSFFQSLFGWRKPAVCRYNKDTPQQGVSIWAGIFGLFNLQGDRLFDFLTVKPRKNAAHA